MAATNWLHFTLISLFIVLWSHYFILYFFFNVEVSAAFSTLFFCYPLLTLNIELRFLNVCTNEPQSKTEYKKKSHWCIFNISNDVNVKNNAKQKRKELALITLCCNIRRETILSMRSWHNLFVLFSLCLSFALSIALCLMSVCLYFYFLHSCWFVAAVFGEVCRNVTWFWFI